MQMNRGGLRPSETTLVIQASIMDLNPQQVLLKDRLRVLVAEVPVEEVGDFVRQLGPQLAADWMDIIRQAEDQDDALRQLLMEVDQPPIYCYVV